MIKVMFDEAEQRKETGGITQWDYGRKLAIYGMELEENETIEVHYALEGELEAFRCPGENTGEYIEAEIPNSLLKDGRNINAYIYRIDKEKGMTIYTVYLIVKKRQKPEDYSAPEDRDVIAKMENDLKGKADGLRLEGMELQLMSGETPIGEAIEIPIGQGGTVMKPIQEGEIDGIMEGETQNGEVS